MLQKLKSILARRATRSLHNDRAIARRTNRLPNIESLEIRTLLAFDFGDAPDSGFGTAPANYNTLASDNGPSHLVSSSIFLGATVDGESVTTGRAGSLRKAPKRGLVGGVNLTQTNRVLRHARLSPGSGCTRESSLHPDPPYSHNSRVTRTLGRTSYLSLFRDHG